MSDTEFNSNEEVKIVAPSGMHHSFDKAYAIAYGVDEALMIHNFQFFISANRAKNQHFQEGRWWTYDKLEDFPKHFPYWSLKQIRRIIKSLVDQNIIITGAFNSHWSNRTCWYAFVNEEKFLGKEEIKKNSAVKTKWATGNIPNGKMPAAQMGISIYKDTSTITSTITSTPPIPPQELKKSFRCPDFQDTEVLKKDKDAAKAASKIEISQEAKELAKSFVDELKQSKPDYVSTRSMKALEGAAQELLSKDKRDPAKCLALFKAALGDKTPNSSGFCWSPHMFQKNPVSYFREKYDKLDMHFQSKKRSKSSAHNYTGAGSMPVSKTQIIC